MAWNIADLIEHAVDAVPDRVALIVGDRIETYAQLEERANRLAHHLAGATASVPGDHVGIYGFNSLEFVETILAAYKLRAVPINVNYRYVEAELRYLFDNADLVALVHDAQFASRIAAVRDSLPMLRHLDRDRRRQRHRLLRDRFGAVRRRARRRRRRNATSARAATTTSTSSTPAARPACRRVSCGARKTCIRVLGGGIDFDTGEKIADECRFSRVAAATRRTRARASSSRRSMHGAAQWGTFDSLFNGKTLVLMPKFDADEVWKAIEQHRITGLEHHRRRDGAAARRSARGRRLRRVVARHGREHRRGVLGASVKDKFLERFPNLDHRRSGRLDRDRLQRCDASS